MQHTPIVIARVPGYPSVEFIFKNESATASGSLKHRYAWALVMWALVEGHVGPNTIVYEASSGNTAAAEAYMCRLIGVKFTCVVPDTIEEIKAQHIEEFGASVVKVDIGKRIEAATEAAARNRGFFMNQFANSDKAEEFHESGDFELESVNVLHEITFQLKAVTGNRNVAPDFFVHSAGTGGTISSAGRYAKKYNLPTQIVLADTEFSIYLDYVLFGKFTNESGASLWVKPGMAGTGYGPLGAAIKDATTSLTPSVIDRVIKVPDLGSTASMHFLRTLGVNGGTSTGINFLAALSIAAKEERKRVARTEPVRISLLLADNGANYESSYYNRTWIRENFAPHGGLRTFDCWYRVIENAYNNGGDPIALGSATCPSPLQKPTVTRL
ncbi:Pyridoxal-phosphate dependent enzyme family protein [Aphelenchoides avenae]|nr:Pyridoxal-phosphate dependent enzyme family protein [Aphelenchus avenae]